MFFDRPHHIVHRHIVLYLVGVFLKRVEHQYLHIDDFSPLPPGGAAPPAWAAAGGTDVSLIGVTLPGFAVLADLDTGAPPEPVSLPLSVFSPIGKLLPVK